MGTVSNRVALLSVFDKMGIVDFARSLIELGFTLLASGGTAKKLRESGVKVTDVAELVGGGAILGHKVVTLSRELHAGLLADMTSDEEMAEMKEMGLHVIDLVCVDLYPLHDAVREEGATTESVIEKTDIGGPTMLRAAAKGGRIVICDPADRNRVLHWIRTGEPDREEMISQLRVKVERVVADYCLASARFHSEGMVDGVIGWNGQELRYGENAWQTPAVMLRVDDNDPLAIHRFKLESENQPSYVTITDVDRALQTLTHMLAVWSLNTDFGEGGQPVAMVAVKHGNPCGASYGRGYKHTVFNTVLGDPLAVMGAVIACNFPIGEHEAMGLLQGGMPDGEKRFFAAVVAPRFTREGLRILTQRGGKKCVLMSNHALSEMYQAPPLDISPRFRQIRGGLLRQPNYTNLLDVYGVELPPSETELAKNLALAWAVAATSNSNTITLVRDSMLIGNGVGQQDRVGAAELAISRARRSGHEVCGAVACSDSFFPFPDGPEVLIRAGVKEILTTSGSLKDDEVKELVQKLGGRLWIIPDSEGRMFYNH